MPNPFAERRARVYRTGDLGAAADGRLEFLGRIDHQVKIRGFRIELGRDRGGAGRAPAVREAAVVAREDSRARSGWSPTWWPRGQAV